MVHQHRWASILDFILPISNIWHWAFHFDVVSFRYRTELWYWRLDWLIWFPIFRIIDRYHTYPQELYGLLPVMYTAEYVDIHKISKFVKYWILLEMLVQYCRYYQIVYPLVQYRNGTIQGSVHIECGASRLSAQLCSSVGQNLIMRWLWWSIQRVKQTF
jgi:hypothetical protein